MAPGKRGLLRGLKTRHRTVVLVEDETIVTETPPLHAAWALRGQQAEVPIVGNRDKRILYGVLNVKSGHVVLHDAALWNQYEFQVFLRKIRRSWRGWNIVLFLDRASQHTSNGSQTLAFQLGIELRWLPPATPELNPMDHLWRHVKGEVLANEPMPNVVASAQRACQYILALTPVQRLRKAGVLSSRFWLRNALP